MSLEEYNKKRDFSKTEEPKAGRSKDKDHLMFVVQKHDASRLHYDFRLELDGVLVSWAVPKGPMMDATVKHLAMKVEDHPFDYRNFEGIIPEGEYGGGTVIVWDQGTYEPLEEIKGKKAQEKHLLKQLASGSVKIKLFGEKLKGEFALVKTHGMGENAWLMIKHKDEFSAKADITKKDKSVLSGKTIEEMEKTSEKVWQHGHEEEVDKPKKTVKKKVLDQAVAQLTDTAEKTETDPISIDRLLEHAPETLIPAKVKPMKATLVNEPFDDPDWLYEIKWDGYRALARVSQTGAELISRNNIAFTKYYPIVDLLGKWQTDALIDGEVVVINDKGISDFGALQNWKSEADGHLVYYVFDILWYQGKNLMELPLVQRQAILKEILPTDDDRIRQSQSFATSGIEFFDATSRIGLEGIMAKKADSTYSSDLRSKEWLKVKVQRRQEVVIAGFTRNEGTTKSFSALVLGVYDQGKLRLAGKVGTGFNTVMQKEMMAQFTPLITDEFPFDVQPISERASGFRPSDLGQNLQWLKPELVCEVNFAEVTEDGIFRQASFKGMRTDKKAQEVVLEVPQDTQQTVEAVQEETRPPIEAVKPPQNKERRTLLNPN